MELPLWLVEEQGMLEVDASRALAAGLTFRPLAQTVADTLAWAGDDPAALGSAGMAPEKEASLLRALAAS
jgi:2'-hydroxyisoflavone reductase